MCVCVVHVCVCDKKGCQHNYLRLKSMLLKKKKEIFIDPTLEKFAKQKKVLEPEVPVQVFVKLKLERNSLNPSQSQKKETLVARLQY